MVLPIGFFAPLPLPMMIPFMGIQSAVMAEQFGTMFQYGKRRISAMGNDEFNALTPAILQQRMTDQIQAMIPQMQNQIEAMRPLVRVIINEFGNYIGEAADVVSHAVGGPHLISHAGTVIPSPETTTMCPAGSHWDATRGTCVPDTSPTQTIEVGDILQPLETTTPQQTISWQGATLTKSQVEVKLGGYQNEYLRTEEQMKAGGCLSASTDSDWCLNMRASIQRTLVQMAELNELYKNAYGNYMIL